MEIIIHLVILCGVLSSAYVWKRITRKPDVVTQVSPYRIMWNVPQPAPVLSQRKPVSAIYSFRLVLLLISVLSGFSLVLTSDLANAGTDPVSLCQSAKTKAASKRIQCFALEQTRERLRRPANPEQCKTAFADAIAAADRIAADERASCRYVDNGDGTISDLNTLLHWETKDLRWRP